jgi:hypothetical protein
MSVILPNRPQNPLELLITAGKIWKASMVPTFILYLLQYVVSNFGNLLKVIYPGGPNTLPLSTNLIILIVSILVLVLTVSFYISIVFRTNNIINNQDVGFGQTVNYGFRKFFPFLVVCLLFVFGFLLSSFLLIIPGIIFLVYFIFSTYFVIFGQGIIDSFKSSYGLVKDHWWRSALMIGIALLPFILIFMLLVALIVKSGLTPEGFQQWLDDPSIALAGMAIQLIIFIPFAQYLNSFFLAYFYDLHNRKKISLH